MACGGYTYVIKSLRHGVPTDKIPPGHFPTIIKTDIIPTIGKKCNKRYKYTERQTDRVNQS